MLAGQVRWNANRDRQREASDASAAYARFDEVYKEFVREVVLQNDEMIGLL